MATEVADAVVDVVVVVVADVVVHLQDPCK
jgi:hypothetical protein